MTTIVACIDGSPISPAVCDAGAWASQRLAAPLKLLHVLEKTEFSAGSDLSGSIGLGSREHLLEELTALDEQRGKLALEHGRHLLERAEQRIREQAELDISTLQRHGSLVECLLELESDMRLLVMGRLGEGHDVAAHTLGSHLENVVRAMHRPIMVTTPRFTPPRSFILAYDGSATAEKALSLVCTSPLLQGLECHLVMVTDSGQDRSGQLAAAADQLLATGYRVTVSSLEGEVVNALSDYRAEHAIDLIVMGAYGHSRIRQFFVGSNTARMVSSSDVPLILLR